MARAKKSPVVGLSIEPGRVAAARVAINGAIAVEHGATAELEVMAIRDGEVVDADSLSRALSALFDEHKQLGRRVRIGVANARIVVRTLDLPPVADPRQLDPVVRFAAAEEIPMPLDSVVLDYHALGLVETPDGPRQRIILVAARKDMIETILSAARAAGLKPEGVDLSAFGMLRAVARPDDGASELYVSVGGLTNLAITTQGVCSLTRTAGTGLEGMALELAERQQLTQEHARMWLFHTGLEDAVEALEGDAAILADARAVLVDGTRRVAGEIRGSLEFHHGQLTEGSGVERVVLTGPAVAVPGFTAALQAELGMPVQERVVAGAGAELAPFEAACLSVAAGLAVEEVPA